MPRTSTTHHRSSWLPVARYVRFMSQKELATRSGISRVQISHLETGFTHEPRDSTKIRLARALGYSVRELFPPPGKPSPNAELCEWAETLGSRNGSPA